MPEIKPMTKTELDSAYREKASALHGDEGSIEFDETATVSVSDDHGAYVQAWIWVPDSEFDGEQRQRLDAGRKVQGLSVEADA